MKKNDENSKERLFEVMKKINPNIIKEQIGLPGDVKTAYNAYTTSPAQQNANKRIDNPAEFAPAFKLWFSSLGFNPQAKNIPIAKVVTDVTTVLRQLGFK
jgi:hypothetical protein